MLDSLHPILITQAAIGKHVQQIALELNCDDSTVYRYCGNEANDPYTRFCAVHRAAAKVNPEGAELYFQDFKTRHLALSGDDDLKGVNREIALSDALNVVADAVRTSEDSPIFRLKVARVIRTLEWLLRQQEVKHGRS